MSQRKIYFVGAGSGDIKLITIKGHQLICQADVILHDRLIPTELLNLVKPTAEVISVAKFAGRRTMPQGQTNMTAIRLAHGCTRRDKIIKFVGCYHGHVDHLLV